MPCEGLSVIQIHQRLRRQSIANQIAASAPPLRARLHTLIGRPLGAFIFGHLGDVIGRRRTTMIAVAGFATFTFLMALLPGYATWGYGAIALLIVLRLIDGVFMGGEYTNGR